MDKMQKQASAPKKNILTVISLLLSVSAAFYYLLKLNGVHVLSQSAEQGFNLVWIGLMGLWVISLFSRRPQKVENENRRD